MAKALTILGVKLCRVCGKRSVACRGLCYKCYANRSIRDSVPFRGRPPILDESVSCKNCKKRQRIKGKRGLCVKCWEIPLVREMFPNGHFRKCEIPLTDDQRKIICETLPEIINFVKSMAYKWAIIKSDKEELLSAAYENICRRGARLDSSKPNFNPRSFLKQAALYGMRFALKHGPLQKPNTVYLADMDTDGRTIYRNRFKIDP